MCGIFVSYRVDNIDNRPLEIVKHRGPDALKMIDFHNGLCLGHVRLSIIDLSDSANQPFSDDETFWIVYNGEIYNYIELKEELIKYGYIFTTTSDTEVLLKAYMHWGNKCLDRLNGMFAFVIYDKKNNILFAARDRFGVKPLYFYQNNDRSFVFASEIKQFTTLNNFKTKANIPRCVDFISWRIFNHTEETLFRDVYQLKGGDYIELHLSNERFDLRKEIKTWYPHTILQNCQFNGDENEIYERFRQLFFDAVRIRLRSDVPISICLSGGIDSSSLACTIDKITADEQTVFSCCNYEKKYDEFEYAEAVINKIKTKQYYKIYPEKQMVLEHLKKVVWHNDEPVGSNSILAQHHLFRNIHEKCFKVALNGQGADEVLGTYGIITPYLNELKDKNLIKFLKEAYLLNNKEQNIVYEFLRFLKKIYQLYNKQLYPNKFIDIYSSDMGQKDNPHNYLPRQKGLDTTHSLRDYNIFILKYSSLPMLLQYDDRNSMAYSVESRVPFLDYRLVEFVMSIPSEYKIKNGMMKSLLRESIKDILPDKIYKRKTKLGFATPQHEWIIQDMRKMFEDRIRYISATYPIFNKYKLLSQLSLISDPVYNSLLWRIIIFDIWAKAFNITL